MGRAALRPRLMPRLERIRGIDATQLPAVGEDAS